MGWTGTHATHYKNGTVDRKAECDELFKTELNAAKTHMLTLLKSAMVGSVYYAAIERKSLDGSDRVVSALICLTRVDSKDYYNFYYKDMTESCGPCESQCPMSILKLLTPTDHEYALEWRKRCYAYHESKKSAGTKDLPIGTKIKCIIDGQEHILVKHPPAYQFKTWFWYDANKHQYIKKSMVQNFTVIGTC